MKCQNCGWEDKRGNVCSECGHIIGAKVCKNCDGTGNLDERVGFTLDCAKCNGSGYLI